MINMDVRGGMDCVRKACILVPLIVSSSLLFARAPDTLWTKTYGGIDLDNCCSFQQTSDGGYILFGQTRSFGTGGYYDVYLIKTDSLGDTLWTGVYSIDSSDHVAESQQTRDGGYIICGMVVNLGMFLVRADSLGDTLWTKRFFEERCACYSVQQTFDGGYIMAGSIYRAGDEDIYLVKTDSLGDTLWTKTYGGDEGEFCWQIRQTPDSGYIIIGSIGAALFDTSDIWFLKTDALGDTLWTKTYGGASIEYGFAVDLTRDGGYILAGRTESYGAGYADFWLLKTDANGDTLWARTYGGPDYEEARSVQETTDCGYIVAGYTFPPYGSDDWDVYLVKTDSLGDTLWTTTYGGVDFDIGLVVQQTSDGGYAIVADTWSFGAGEGDIWLIKTAPDTFGVEERQTSRTNSYPMMDISPNPFSDKTKIELNLLASSVAHLAIYDICGRLVDRQTIRALQTGGCSLVWPQTNTRIASGVYLCVLEYDGFKYLSKMIKN